MYGKLVTKVNNVDTSGLVLNMTQIYKRKFLKLLGLLKKKYSAKISEIESKIPSFKGLATNSA